MLIGFDKLWPNYHLVSEYDKIGRWFFYFLFIYCVFKNNVHIVYNLHAESLTIWLRKLPDFENQSMALKFVKWSQLCPFAEKWQCIMHPFFKNILCPWFLHHCTTLKPQILILCSKYSLLNSPNRLLERTTPHFFLQNFRFNSLFHPTHP